jgi:hypothetical protein
MAITFEKIQAGMTLWQRGRQKMGNTTMSRAAEWPVYVKSVDAVERTAIVSWNGNPEQRWFEHQMKRLYTKRMAKKETAQAKADRISAEMERDYLAQQEPK